MSPLRQGLAWLRKALLEDTSTSGTKFATLDGLRGIAVLTVFFSHTSGAGQRLTPWTNFHGTGHLGVYLFFVLSGFLLGYSLLHKPIHFGRFYLRRFFRIAPLYYLVVTAVFWVQQHSKHKDKTSLFISDRWHGYWLHLLFYRGESVFWTVAAEFEFYFILPFFVLLLNWKETAAAWALAFLAAVYFVWGFSVATGHLPAAWAPRVAEILQPSQYLDVFLCGILAAYLFTNKKVHHFYTEHRGWLNPASVILTLIVAMGSVLSVGDRFFVFEHVLPVMHFCSLAYGVAFSAILLATLYGSPVLVWAFGSTPLRVIGVTGFSWYLLHLPLVRLVGRLYASHPIEPLMFATSFVLVGALAILSYLVIEKPFMMMSRMFSGKRPAPVLAPIASSTPL